MDHGIGSPEEAVKDLVKYRRWREGEGFKKGTVVQVKSAEKPTLYVLTRVSEIIPPRVYVNYVFRTVPRLIKNVLPLFPVELSELPEPWNLPLADNQAARPVHKEPRPGSVPLPPTTTTSMIESVVAPAPAVSSVAQLPRSPTQPLRLSIEEKVSRSTGGMSRESEEESADTRQKINLILEQGKQEAERSAATQHLPSVPITALASQASSPSQEVLIDPKAGLTVRLSAPSSVTLTLVFSTPSHQVQSEPRADVITNTAPRAGIPQPTVLPPRHDQQVRLAPRVVPTPVRPPVVSGPRPAMPIQLPTQPLPPESVRKAQPVLLEQEFEVEVKPREQPYQPPESAHHQPPQSQAQVKVQRDPCRQSDSPLYGVPHPYTTTPPSAHVPDPYCWGSTIPTSKSI